MVFKIYKTISLRVFRTKIKIQGFPGGIQTLSMLLEEIYLPCAAGFNMFSC